MWQAILVHLAHWTSALQYHIAMCIVYFTHAGYVAQLQLACQHLLCSVAM